MKLYELMDAIEVQGEIVVSAWDNYQCIFYEYLDCMSARTTQKVKNCEVKYIYPSRNENEIIIEIYMEK